MFEPLRKELSIDTFVSFNGQYVVFENEVIYRNPIKRVQILKNYMKRQRNIIKPQLYL